MTLLAAHTRVSLLELGRYWTFVVPTLAFPAAFFAMFGVPRATEANSGELLAAYAGFAALGVAFFQFGVGIAAERASPWERYLRTLAVRAATRFGARILSALVFTCASVAAVAVVAVLATPLALPAVRWPQLAVAVVLGGVPFALLGIAIGYWLPPRSALPVANLLYLGLSYAGGLWIPPAHLPDSVRRVGELAPTRPLTELLYGAAAGSVPVRSALLLGVWSAAFAGLALAGYRRDEGERFR